MAFTIRKTSGAALAAIESALLHAFSISRFTGRVELHKSNITIHDVRLREKKHYCGNHPNACPVRPGVHTPHKRMNFLEGADWVGFNDMINDVLDSLAVSASAGSSLCKIRKGLMRRMRYVGHFIGATNFREWDKDDTRYECYVRKGRPPTDYPQDTPGVAEWRIENEKISFV
jgi:hypothetical protein